MTDRNKLRRLAETATPGPWRKRWYGSGGYEGREGVTVVTNTGTVNCDEIAYLGRGDHDEDTAHRSRNGAFIAAASPDVVLGLLDEIERLKGECDFFSARSEEERTNRGLAEKDFHDAMELVRQYSAERDTLRAALEAIANHNPAVTHGWAEETRWIARSALKAR